MNTLHRYKKGMKNVQSALMLLIIFYILSMTNCLASEEKSDYRFIGYESMGTISKEQLSDWISNGLATLSAVNVNKDDYPQPLYDVRLFKVKYVTNNPDHKNSVERVSGLVALPVGLHEPLPILSYQHSTEFSRHFVPSNLSNSVEGRIVVASFAAQGYAVFIADYLGKGDSEIMHPYMLPRSEAQTSYDMILAGKTLCKKMGHDVSSDLFLMGWSQGGQSTMALHRLLQEKQEKVSASAPVAGGYDFYLLWELWLTQKTSPFVPAIMANTLQAYEYYQNIDGLVSQSLMPKYQNAIEDMFDDDEFSMSDFQEFPERTIHLLQPGFYQQAFIGNNRFYQALKENEVYMWRPEACIRFYQGQADDIMPPATTEIAYNYMKTMGGNVEVFNTGNNSDHRDSFLVAIPNALKWFNALKTK